MASIKKTMTTNQGLFDLIRDLKKVSAKLGVNVYKAAAVKLSGPASRRPEVNLSRIDRYANEGETIIVPGKVLGSGILAKKVTIVSFGASESAIKKIEAAGAKYVSLKEYISKKPDTKVRIFG